MFCWEWTDENQKFGVLFPELTCVDSRCESLEKQFLAPCNHSKGRNNTVPHLKCYTQELCAHLPTHTPMCTHKISAGLLLLKSYIYSAELDPIYRIVCNKSKLQKELLMPTKWRPHMSMLSLCGSQHPFHYLPSKGMGQTMKPTSITISIWVRFPAISCFLIGSSSPHCCLTLQH